MMGAGDNTTNARGRMRSRVFLIGWALVVLVAVAAVGGYLAFGTRSSGDSTQVAEIASGNQVDVPVQATPGPSPTPAPTSAPTPIPPFLNQTFRIAINKIGVDAPVVPEGMDDQQVPQVPLNGYEVAWYDFSAQPGTPGNAVFAGHKTWAGDAVFHDLDQLEPGDSVEFHGESDGVVLFYKVTESFTVSEDDPNGVQVMLPAPGDIVTIITCDGTRYFTGDPTFGHDYTERRVVRAIRIGTFGPSLS